jgi:hypothetical protein
VGSGTDASNAAAESILAQRNEALASSAADSFLNIDVLCTGFVLSSGALGCALVWLIKSQNRIGLVNENADSIHHVGNGVLIFRLAFIFDERARAMVNRWCAREKFASQWMFRVNSMLNRLSLKRHRS